MLSGYVHKMTKVGCLKKKIVFTHLTKALYKFGCFKEKVWSFLKFWIWQRCCFTELPWHYFLCTYSNCSHSCFTRYWNCLELHNPNIFRQACQFLNRYFKNQRACHRVTYFPHSCGFFSQCLLLILALKSIEIA